MSDKVIQITKGNQTMKKSICNKCSSCGYCRNREDGMMACVNFNKFPKATDSYEEYCREKQRAHALEK